MVIPSGKIEATENGSGGRRFPTRRVTELITPHTPQMSAINGQGGGGGLMTHPNVHPIAATAMTPPITVKKIASCRSTENLASCVFG
jgi:hypothetical protein